MNNSALTGAWKPEMYAEHLPEEIAFDESLLKFTLQVCQPKHALDIGCGLGYFVKYLRDKGVDAWGIEGYDLGSLFKAPGYQIKQDITQPFDLKEKYDLVMCLEVVEHIPREFENIVFDNIVRHMGKYLLFSGAPRQQGTDNVNESSESYWFSHLVRRGLSLGHVASLNARSSSTLSWYANSVSLWEITHPEAYDSYNLIAEKENNILKCVTLINQLHQKLDQTTKLMASTKISYSQCGEDIIVKFIFDNLDVKRPTYLDIGAHDPEYLSNTALFYLYGLRGINIEPDPNLFQKFLNKRQLDINLNIGISNITGEMDFYVMSTPTLNTFSKKEADSYSQMNYSVTAVQKIKVDTISNIIATYCGNKFPDFLSLDTEGMDEIILESINYDASSPTVICVETITFSKTGTGVKNTSIVKFLESKGYMVFADTYINTIFVKRDRWVRG